MANSPEQWTLTDTEQSLHLNLLFYLILLTVRGKEAEQDVTVSLFLFCNSQQI